MKTYTHIYIDIKSSFVKVLLSCDHSLRSIYTIPAHNDTNHLNNIHITQLHHINTLPNYNPTPNITTHSIHHTLYVYIKNKCFYHTYQINIMWVNDRTSSSNVFSTTIQSSITLLLVSRELEKPLVSTSLLE